MKWIELYGESSPKGGQKQVISVELSTREIMLIQNYLNKGNSLNDQENQECQKVVLEMLSKIVKESNIEEVNAYIATFLEDTFGITLDQDPYGQNNSIELNEAGLIPMKGCMTRELKYDGHWSDLVEGGVWNPDNGNFAGGFISVNSINELLGEFSRFDYGIRSMRMKEDGKVAKMMVVFK